MDIREVYAKIDEEWRRVAAAWEERSGKPFPCQPGCSPNCCRTHVEAFPYVYLPMSAAEAEVVREALRALSKFQREVLIRRYIGGYHPSCFLLSGQDECMIYEDRPLWCRIYGLYGTAPICGKIPLEAGADVRWVEIVQWAFEELRSGRAYFIPELVAELMAVGDG